MQNDAFVRPIQDSLEDARRLHRGCRRQRKRQESPQDSSASEAAAQHPIAAKRVRIFEKSRSADYSNSPSCPSPRSPSASSSVEPPPPLPTAPLPSRRWRHGRHASPCGSQRSIKTTRQGHFERMDTGNTQGVSASVALDKQSVADDDDRSEAAAESAAGGKNYDRWTKFDELQVLDTKVPAYIFRRCISRS